MTKETARDIATVLIAISGDNFDQFAFSDSEDLITDKDRDKILDEIKLICSKMVAKVENKYNIVLNVSSTHDIIDKIIYE